MTHWLLAAGLGMVAVVVFLLGWNASIYWAEWQDDKQLRAAEARHARRKGDRVPLARLADPEPLPGEWRFAGESEQGWASESAEYELLTQTADDRHDTCPRCPTCGEHRHGGDCLTQTAEQPVSVTGEPPIDTGELLAITDRVESWIAQWTAQGNVDRHTIQAGE